MLTSPDIPPCAKHLRTAVRAGTPRRADLSRIARILLLPLSTLD